MAQRHWAAQVGGGDQVGGAHMRKIENLSINLMKKSMCHLETMVGQHGTCLRMMVDGKKKGCRPVQQGLARKSTQVLHLETHSMQPRSWRAEPSMAIPVVHIAPPGTNAVDAGWVARWLSGGGLIVVCPRDRCAHACACWWSVGTWLRSRGARPSDIQRHQDS